jgi:hypothetical protein
VDLNRVTSNPFEDYSDADKSSGASSAEFDPLVGGYLGNMETAVRTRFSRLGTAAGDQILK